MTAALIGCLLVLSVWLAIRLGTVSTENASLRARIESLKRQLLRMR